MNVIVMTTAEKGTVQVDLDTGFCIYQATLGKAAGTLMEDCLNMIRETGLMTHASLSLEFKDARMTEGEYVTEYVPSNDNGTAALELTTGLILRSAMSAELADA